MEVPSTDTASGQPDLARLAKLLVDLRDALTHMALCLHEYQFERDSPERQATIQLTKQLLEQHQFRD